MQTINAYLNFPGNTEEAMRFYKSVFGGDFTMFQRYADIPGSDKMSAEDQHKIMHVSLTIKDGLTIMATDTLESMEQTITVGNNFHLCIQAESEAEADKLFSALSSGGKVEMPMNKTFWDAYFGMCEDKFKVRWMINYTYIKNS